MKAKAAFYFLILCRQVLSLERYRWKKGVEVKAHCQTQGFYGSGIVKILFSGHFHQALITILDSRYFPLHKNVTKNFSRVLFYISQVELSQIGLFLNNQTSTVNTSVQCKKQKNVKKNISLVSFYIRLTVLSQIRLFLLNPGSTVNTSVQKPNS